jgi:hypothetical protein
MERGRGGIDESAESGRHNVTDGPILKGSNVTILSHNHALNSASPFLRFEHAASGGDIDAAALTEGAGESCVAEDFLKLHAGGACGAGESAGGIERDEIDVGVDAFE